MFCFALNFVYEQGGSLGELEMAAQKERILYALRHADAEVTTDFVAGLTISYIIIFWFFLLISSLRQLKCC